MIYTIAITQLKIHNSTNLSLEDYLKALAQPKFYEYVYGLDNSKAKQFMMIMYRARILGRNWDNSLKSFPRFSQSPLLTDFTPSPLEQKWVWSWFIM
jgi:hypothetical protein